MKTRILSIAMVMMMLASVSFAQGPQNRSANAKQHQGQQMKKKGNMPMHNFLTDEQKESMKSIKLKTAKEAKPIKDELRELMAHHKTLTTADKPDMAAIDKSIDKMGALKTDLAKIMARSHQSIRALLTDEQRLMMDNHRRAGEPRMHGKADRRSSDRPRCQKAS